jgi:AraC-like DNA-binding protein
VVVATVGSLPRMDVLEALLDGPRARGAFLLRSLLDPPWSLWIEDEAPLTVVAAIRGHAWIAPDGAEPVRLDAGDLAVVRGPGPYAVADDPTTPATVVVGPGNICRSVDDGRSLVEEWSLGVRTWGHRSDAATVLLTGTYETAGEASRPLLAALPRVAVLTSEAWGSPLPGLLADELSVEAPGQRALLDRLLDVVLIAALRSWFTTRAERAPAWFLAQSDPVVGQALARIHAAPEQPWTVASLAAAAGVSRASLARRFTELLGRPPLAYLTSWRLALAADLLGDQDRTVASVARQVGYGTPFALSAAFKREHGMSPSDYRRRT